MDFNNFIAVDWSGDKNKFQKGISVAQCPMGRYPPKIIKPEEDLDQYLSSGVIIFGGYLPIGHWATLIPF